MTGRAAIFRLVPPSLDLIREASKLRNRHAGLLSVGRVVERDCSCSYECDYLIAFGHRPLAESQCFNRRAISNACCDVSPSIETVK